jgi:hypothetical protein
MLEKNTKLAKLAIFALFLESPPGVGNNHKI